MGLIGLYSLKNFCTFLLLLNCNFGKDERQHILKVYWQIMSKEFPDWKKDLKVCPKGYGEINW